MLAKGLQLQIGDAGSPTEAFTQITGMVEIDWGGRTWEVEETTPVDTASKVTTRQLTVSTDNNLSLLFKPWDPANNAQHALLEALSRTGAARNYKFINPAGSIGVMGPFEAQIVLKKKETPTKGIWAGRVELMPTAAIADALPSLASVAITDALEGAYTTADVIELSATFDEVVKVTGTPRIAITLGSGTVYATFVTPSTHSNVLVFRKTVGGGDAATAGQMSVGTSIDLNGGTILDMIGQAPAALTFSAPDTASFTVN